MGAALGGPVTGIVRLVCLSAEHEAFGSSMARRANCTSLEPHVGARDQTSSPSLPNRNLAAPCARTRPAEPRQATTSSAQAAAEQGLPFSSPPSVVAAPRRPAGSGMDTAPAPDVKSEAAVVPAKVVGADPTPGAEEAEALAAAKAPSAPVAKMDTRPLLGTRHTAFTLEEVAKHSSPDDCWLVAHGIVYDVTEYIVRHPGGTKAITRHGGMVCDEDFDFHSPLAQNKAWSRYAIGYVPSERACAVM